MRFLVDLFNGLFLVCFIDLAAQAKRRWDGGIVAGDLFLVFSFQGWAAIWGHNWPHLGWLSLALVDAWEIRWALFVSQEVLGRELISAYTDDHLFLYVETSSILPTKHLF